MSELQQFCMSCGGGISYTADQAGTSIFCMHCGQKVQLKSDSATPPEPSQSPPPPAINDTPEEFFLFIDNQQHGPYSEANLSEYLKAGQITPETLVWWEGKEGWEPLSQQTELNLGLTSFYEDDDDDDDDDDDTYFAKDCVCGETAKLTGDLLQSYIDDEQSYECEECEREIDPSFGWYSITLDKFVEDDDEEEDYEEDHEECLAKIAWIQKLAWGFNVLHLIPAVIVWLLIIGAGDEGKKTTQYWRNSWSCLFWSCQVVDRDFEGTSVFSKKYAPAIKCKFFGITYWHFIYASNFIEKSQFGNQTSGEYVEDDESEGHPSDYYSFMERWGYLFLLSVVTGALLDFVVLPFALGGKTGFKKWGYPSRTKRE